MRISSRAGLKRVGLLSLAIALVTVPLAGQSSPYAPEEVLQRIQGLVQSGDTTGAQAELSRALAAYPKEPVLHNFLGVLEAQQGNYRQAESSFTKAIELAPGFAAAYVNLGRLYQENVAADNEAIKKGIATYQGLVRLDPDNVEANYQIAVLYQAKGSFREALSHLERLPADVQDRPQALALRCAVEAGLGDVAKAEAWAHQLLKSPDLSVPDVDLVLPALAKLNDNDLAVLLLEGLVQRRLASADTLRRLASLYETRGELGRARQTYEKSAEAGNVTAPLLVDLARVAYKEKDFEGALSYLAHARDLEPRNSGIHFFFGMACVEMDLPVEAEKSLRAAIELDPGNPYYNYALGAVIANGRKWKEAVPFFEKYSRKKPDDPRGKLALASAHFHSFELDLARKELNELVDKPETEAGARFHLGLLAIQERTFEEAIRELRRAVQVNPNYAEAYGELGFAHLQLEQYDEARKALERAVQLDPDSRRANIVLLALYQRTDDPRAADQAERFRQLKEKQAERAKMFLRTIDARPY